MGAWGDSATSQSMRDLITQIARNVIENERPAVRYATVNTIDRPARKCTVTFIGGSVAVPVSMGSVQPNTTGQMVRIGGPLNDRYIEAVLGDSYQPQIDHGSLSGLGDDDHTQYLLSGGDTMTGALTLPDGAAGTPALRFDANTGIFSSADESIDFATNATRRMGIKDTSPHVDIVTGAGAGDCGLLISASAHGTSQRASILLDSWMVGQDFLADGTEDFFVYDANAGLRRFGLDTSGRMALPVQPWFLLRHSATITVANATTVDHPWDTEVSDTYGFHSGSDAFVTVPVTGLYFFAAATHADTVTTDGTRQLFFLVDNSDPSNGNNNRYQGAGVGAARGAASGYAVPNVTAVIHLTAGQTVYVKCYQTTNASQTWGVASRKELNFFTGALLWRTA